MKYTSAGDQLPTVLSTAVQGGNPPSVAFVAQPGLMQDFVKQGALKPIEYARDVVEENYSPRLGRPRQRRRQALRLRVQGRQQVDRLVQRQGLQRRRRRSRPTTWDELLEGGRRRSRRPACRRTPSAAPTAGPSPTCSRTSTCAPPVPTSTTSWPRTRSRGPTRRSPRRSRTMAQIFSDTQQHRRRHAGRPADRLPDLGDPGLQRPAQGRHGLRGRLRAGRDPRLDQGPAGDRTSTSSPSRPSRTGRPSVVGGGDTVVTFKDDAGDAGVRRVPGDAAGRRDLGQDRRLLVAEQERRSERLPRPDLRRRPRRRWPARRPSAST